MKKILLFCSLFLMASSLYALDGLYISQNIDIGDNQTILILSDNSIWRLYPVHERSRSWSEWWNNVQIEQPEKEFLGNFTKWSEGCAVCVHPYDGRPLAKYNNEDLFKCGSFIELVRADKLAFAQGLDVKSFCVLIPSIFKHQYNSGYNEGYNSGYLIGHNSGYYAGAEAAKSAKRKTEQQANEKNSGQTTQEQKNPNQRTGYPHNDEHEQGQNQQTATKPKQTNNQGQQQE